MQTNKKDPEYGLERQREHFNSIADKYFSSRRGDKHLLLKRLIWDFFFSKSPKFPEHANVLEPMCGYAEGMEILKRSNIVEIDYTGFDYSEEILSKVASVNPGLNIFHGDITKFVPEKTYDIVIILGGLHHVPKHVDVALEKVHQSLAPGGFFINFEPTQNNYLIRKVRKIIYKKNDLFDEQTEEAFDLTDLNRRTEQRGFQLVTQTYPGLLAYILYYNPDAFPLLNVGGQWLTKLIFNLEKIFYTNVVGKKLSFATMSLWKKT